MKVFPAPWDLLVRTLYFLALFPGSAFRPVDRSPDGSRSEHRLDPEGLTL